MINYIWILMIVISVVISLFTGRAEQVAAAAMTGAGDAITLVISLAGTMCFFSGLMQIADKSGMTDKIARMARPVFRILFPKLDINGLAAKAMLMNIAANVLGMGNASTPLGLRAMKELDKIGNSDSASNDMILFVVLNTAAFQIIPTTLIAMRTSAGSNFPAEILVPVWIASFCAAFVGVLCVKLLK